MPAVILTVTLNYGHGTDRPFVLIISIASILNWPLNSTHKTQFQNTIPSDLSRLKLDNWDPAM